MFVSGTVKVKAYLLTVRLISDPEPLELWRISGVLKSKGTGDGSEIVRSPPEMYKTL